MPNYPIDYQVKTADGQTQIVGISQMGTKVAPGTPGWDANIAATSGDIIGVFADEDNDEVLLYLGASVTGGQLLKSDSNGLGVPLSLTSTSAQYVGAEARQTGASGDLIKVRPRINATGRMA
jgi:hypothetical protein